MQSGIVFVFKSPLNPSDHQYGNHMVMHGDAVKSTFAYLDVAFTVDDCRGIYDKAISRGARSVRETWEESVFLFNARMSLARSLWRLLRRMAM